MAEAAFIETGTGGHGGVTTDPVTMADLEPPEELTVWVDRNGNWDPRRKHSIIRFRVLNGVVAAMLLLLAQRSPNLVAIVVLSLCAGFAISAPLSRLQLLPSLPWQLPSGPRRVRTPGRRAAGPLAMATAIAVWGALMLWLPQRVGLSSFHDVCLVVFGLVACWMVFRAFVAFTAGDLHVSLSPYPVVGGDDLLVRLAIGSRAAAVRRIELRLLCTRPQPGGQTGVAEVLAEQCIQLDDRTQLPDEDGAIELRLPIPVDAPPTDRAAYTWRLQVQIWSGFGSFRENFQVPVRSSLFRSAG